MQIPFSQLALALAPVTRPIPGDSPMQECDLATDHSLDLHSLTIDPNPPNRGANLTITALGTLSKDVVDGAYVDVVVNYGYIRLISQTYNLCEQLPNVDMNCPLNSGEYKLTKEIELPSEIPPGKYTVFARAYNNDDSMITCLTGTIEFPQLL